MAPKWSAATHNETLAGHWHMAIAILYVGALIFHVLSALEHWSRRG